MAGGFGQRLRPLTDEAPKPMLPVNGRPLMEHIIEQLRKAGINQVSIATHYKPEVITNHFGDGRALGVNINYIFEDHPLGTAGALGLMVAPTSPILVINGDILTQLDFRVMHAFHETHGALLTVGVRKYDLQIPYGVVELKGLEIVRLEEKPVQTVLVNAGIYLLESEVYHYIPRGAPCDMTDLIQTLVRAGKRVISFPICEYWMDIGNLQDYQRAGHDISSGEFGRGGH
jgi:NDP-sugar pyrophosphorylase family protein